VNDFLQVLVFIAIALLLLWFGYTLFCRLRLSSRRTGSGSKSHGKSRGKTRSRTGEPQPCPVCSAELYQGELVSSLAFPSLNGGNDRFMHIRGCIYCLNRERERICPVCRRVLQDEEILICRLFERPLRRAHVHVLGCTRCRGPASGR